MGLCTEDRKAEGIVPEMSVLENLTLALLPKISRRGIVWTKRASAESPSVFIRELGIKCSGPDQKVSELSGGNQQKVLLARWLAMNPRLLILDEPTRGIDVGAKGEIQRLVRRLADEGLGVLMISSELEEVIEGANRIFVLREGVSVASFEGGCDQRGRGACGDGSWPRNVGRGGPVSELLKQTAVPARRSRNRDAARPSCPSRALCRTDRCW